LREGGGKLGDADVVGWGEVGFAAEPVFEGDGEAVDGDAGSGFEQAVSDGEGVVEDGVVGEVAHGEVVELGDGAGVGCACGIDAFDLKFAEEHRRKVSCPRDRGLGVG